MLQRLEYAQDHGLVADEDRVWMALYRKKIKGNGVGEGDAVRTLRRAAPTARFRPGVEAAFTMGELVAEYPVPLIQAHSGQGEQDNVSAAQVE